MDQPATLTEVCQQISDIKKLMKEGGVVAYRNDGDWNTPENVNWGDLFQIALRDHVSIDLPNIRALAVADAEVRGIHGGIPGIIGHALQLAANGKLFEAGEALEAFADVILETFAGQLAHNLHYNRMRYGKAESPQPLSQGLASFHDHGVVVVDQNAPSLLKQAV